MSATPDSPEKKSILFENGQSAQVLHIRQAQKAAEILETLNISAEAAIIVAGSTQSFPTRLKNRLTDLLSRGIAYVAGECDAILIDEGIKDGVSEIIGQGVADRGRKTILIGVLPQTKLPSSTESVTAEENHLDANHTHFVVSEQDRPGWQAQTMCDLAVAASKNKDWILTVLVGGESDGTALDLALETVRRGWHLVVIEGSGALADEIVTLQKEKLASERRTTRIWRQDNGLMRLQETNPRLYEIISDGKIIIIGTSFDALQLRKMIKGLFTHPPKENILWTAWQQFAEYDLNSIRHRNQWRRLKNIPLILSVASTLIVLIYSAAEIDNTNIVGEVQNQLWTNGYTAFMNLLAGIRANTIVDLFFRFIIILLPITSSVILSIETRRKLGSKYILLRGAAEAVKRGIYSYRVLGNKPGNSAEVLLPYNELGLATHLGKISKFLLESDVNEAAFTPYEGRIPPTMFGAAADDDGFSFLDPEKYIKIRVGDQLKFYTSRTNEYERRLRRLQTWMLIFGAIGTFLAAVGAQYWLPFTAAMVAAFTAYLEYQQWEQILTKYNLTKASLENTRANWLAMSDEDKRKNIQKLVRDVEAILESENQGWVQYVNQVQEEPGAKSNNKAEKSAQG
jgi:hypothetical protein